MIRGKGGADTYRRMEADTRSPIELVVMLYDGAIRFVGEARDAIARNDVHRRTESSRRALDVVSELQNTLNVKEGGEIARELDRLYTYMTSRILDITRGDAQAAEETHNLLITLRDGWSQAASATIPAPTPGR